ncbi:MAG: ribonuclease III domain-containing protein [Candidatus Wallbacteria bacterium]|nr:ribonuclease III domain-containing protein [Candidatus Wallbacteria bacterium]
MRLFPKIMPGDYSPLLLAYVGDAVYDLFFRMRALQEERYQVRVCHTNVVGFVNARKQCQLLRRISPHLTPEELEIIRRARNKKIPTHPKGSTMAEYRQATALECLIGHYFLLQDFDNLERIFGLIMAEAELDAKEGDHEPEE